MPAEYNNTALKYTGYIKWVRWVFLANIPFAVISFLGTSLLVAHADCGGRYYAEVCATPFEHVVINTGRWLSSISVASFILSGLPFMFFFRLYMRPKKKLR